MLETDLAQIDSFESFSVPSYGFSHIIHFFNFRVFYRATIKAALFEQRPVEIELLSLQGICMLKADSRKVQLVLLCL